MIKSKVFVSVARLVKEGKFQIILALALLLSVPTVSHSYLINDPVGDRIGEIRFETYGIDVLNPFGPGTAEIKLYTNYPSAGLWIGLWPTKPADVALDLNRDGIFESAIALTSHNGFMLGGVYTNVTWYTSDHYAPAWGGIDYGYNNIVRIRTGDWVAGAAVNWYAIGSSPRYCVDITGFNSPGAPFDIFWATATCANDVTGGHVVPVPASILLMGSGLIGFGIFLRGFGKGGNRTQLKSKI